MHRGDREGSSTGPRTSRTGGLRLDLICGVGTGNLGNDASLDAAMSRMRAMDPDIGFRVVSPFPDGAADRLGLPAIPIRQDLASLRERSSGVALLRDALVGEGRRLLAMHRQMTDSSAVVVTGTGILDDFEERPWGMPYALLSWALMARLHRRPFVLMAIGAGPIHSPVNRLIFRTVARCAQRVSYRDLASRAYMAALGGSPADAPVCPDLVFGLERPPARPADPAAPGSRIGIGVMDYDGWPRAGDERRRQAYVRTVVKVVEHLDHLGHTVVLMPGQPCDVSVIDLVRAGVGGDLADRLEQPDITDLAGLMEVMADLDAVVATRFHHVVAAVMMSRPVVSLSYAPKNGELLRALSLADFDTPIEDATAGWVLDRVTRLRDEVPQGSLPEAHVIEAWAGLVDDEVRTVLTTIGRPQVAPAR